MAQEWRDFYKQVKASNPGNPSAEGRAELMQRAYELLGRKTKAMEKTTWNITAPCGYRMPIVGKKLYASNRGVMKLQ
jgi:uncharacterized protein DUF4951